MTRMSESLEGIWNFVEGIRDGKPGPPMQAIFTFAGDRLLIDATENGKNRRLSYSFKVGPAKNTLTLTLLDVPHAGESGICTFEFQEDELRLDFLGAGKVMFVLRRDSH